jgi:preprotein translocase subunit SecG
MLKIIAFIINLSLIAVISFKIPKENMGLSSFATKSNLLGSPASAQRFLNRATAVGI